MESNIFQKIFVKEAKQNTESDPFVKQSTLEEIQGYGYQLWQNHT